jgi:hypothetical protein
MFFYVGAAFALDLCASDVDRQEQVQFSQSLSVTPWVGQ